MGFGQFQPFQPCNRHWLVGDESKKHDPTLIQKQSLNRKKKLLARKFQKEDKDPWQDVPKYHLAGHKLDPMFFGIYRLLEKNEFCWHQSGKH